MTGLEPVVGPIVDDAPRPLPARIGFAGTHMKLEPLHRRHAADLWQAAVGADDSWAYLAFGPFASEAELRTQIDHFTTQHDALFWAIRPIASGKAVGWLSLMDIQPRNAAIELGNIWFAPALRRTRAATEAVYTLLRHAADDLGYRRLVWKCNALNAPSIRAAERLGFTAEGVLRAHMVVKGRQRDTAYFSILDHEWPRCEAALRAWLDAGNFDAEGNALQDLTTLRHTR